LASVSLALFCVTSFFLLIIGWRHTLKPSLVLMFLVSSIASYFMNTYNVVIDVQMLRNVFQTDMAESMDLLSPKLAGYLFFLGCFPRRG
jgi:lipid A ethanolaminephosphotransferase